MARTKQTARKSTFGKAPRKQYSYKLKKKIEEEIDSYGYDSDLDDCNDNSSSLSSHLSEQCIMENFALSSNRKDIVDKLVIGSASYYYYSALNEIHSLKKLEYLDINDDSIINILKLLNNLNNFTKYKNEALLLRQQVYLLLLDKAKTNDQISHINQFWIETLKVKIPNSNDINNNNMDIDNEDNKSNNINQKISLDLSNNNIIKSWISNTQFFDENNNSFPCISSIHEKLYPLILYHLTNNDIYKITMKDRITCIRNIISNYNIIDNILYLDCIITDIENSWINIFKFSLNSSDKLYLQHEIKAKEFGTYSSHSQLNKKQLDYIIQKIPKDTLNNSSFVQVYLENIISSEDDIKILKDKFYPLKTNLTIQELDFIKGYYYIDNALIFLHKCCLKELFSNPNIIILKTILLHYFHLLVFKYQKSLLKQEDLINYLKYKSNIPKDNKSNQCSQTTSYNSVSYIELPYYLPYIDDNEIVNDIILPYLPYFKKAYLLRLLAKVKLMNMDKYSTLWCRLMGRNSIALSKLTELQILKFDSTNNPQFYQPNDSVYINVTIKNIKRLIIQVYAINISYHFKQYKQPLSFNNINIDGLVANYEDTIELDNLPSIQKISKKIHIPLISEATSGLFVVEIVGGSKACSAIIHKGYIHIINTTVLEGHKIDIIDEDGNIITKQCSITTNNDKKYSPNNNGDIILPFYDPISDNSKNITENPICKNTFVMVSRYNNNNESSFITSLTQNEKSFILCASMFIDNEQLYPNCKANLYIKPKLFLNNTCMPLSLLTNIIITMVATLSDNSKITKEFTSIELSYSKETILEIIPPINTINLQFTLSADVNIYNNNNIKGITAREARFTEVKDTYSILVGISKIKQKSIYFPFLSYSNNEYIIKFLGRSGEPLISNECKEILLKHKYTTTILKCNIIPDNNGCIYLGSLKNIESISVFGFTWNITESNFHSFWNPKSDTDLSSSRSIPYKNSTGKNCMKIHGIVNQQIEIPLPSEFNNSSENNIDSFFELYFLNPLNSYKAISLKNSIKIKNGFLYLTFKDSGEYELLYIKDYINISIMIHPANILNIKINNDSFIQTNTFDNTISIIENLSKKYMQMYSKIEDNNLIIQLKNHSNNTRIHIIGRCFLPTQAILAHNISTIPINKAKEHYNYDIISKCDYKEARKISEEYQYILQRRSSIDNLHGNFLPHPSLFIHPYQVKKTKIQPTSNNNTNNNERNQIKYPSTHIRDSMLSSIFKSKISNESPYAPFLPNSSTIISNLTLSDNSNEIILSLDKDLNNSSEIYICAVSDNDIISHHHHNNNSKPLIYKNMALLENQAFPNNIHLSEHQGVTLLKENNTLILTQTETLRYKVIDSIKKLYYLLDAKSNYNILFNEYIIQWNSYTEEKKLEYYNLDASHELTLFIYFKDKVFFDKYILSCIKSKNEKQFIDYFILNEDLTRFLQLDYFLHLSIIERILLAIRFPNRRNDILLHFNDLYKKSPIISSSQKHANFILALTSTDSSISKSIEFRSDSNSKRNNNNRYNRINTNPSKIRKTNYSQQIQQQQYNDDDDDEDEDDYYEEEQDYYNNNASNTNTIKIFTNRKISSNTWQINEKQYHNGTIEEQTIKGNVSLTNTCKFYLDIIEYLNNNTNNDISSLSNFLSSNFMEVNNSYTELMFVLSVIDLPFNSIKENEILTPINNNDTNNIIQQVSLRAHSSCIVFHNDLRIVKNQQKSTTNLIISQSIYDINDSISHPNPEEYIAGNIYECKLALLNTSSSKLDLLNVLFQIPTGSITVGNNTSSTTSRTISIEAHGSYSISYQFYFQCPGIHYQYPAHVSKGDELIAVADIPSKFNVVSKQKSKIDTLSWKDVSSRGSDIEFLNFLEQKDINITNISFDSSAISKRLQNKELYLKVIQCLRKRFVYNSDVWKYSLHHNDLQSIGEYLVKHPKCLLTTDNNELTFCCPNLGLFPLKTRGIKNNLYEHLEYTPLIHSRVHSNIIMNENLKEQYLKFLKQLIYKDIITDEDILESIYYLLIQNRIYDAYNLFIQRFKSLDTSANKNISIIIQYDYIRAYLDIYYGKSHSFKIAKDITEYYLSSPLLYWKEKFKQMNNLIKEHEKLQDNINNPTKNINNLPILSNNAPILEPLLRVISVTNTHINISLKNIKDSLQLNYYLMDVEATFSFEPFADMSSSRCCFIQPSFNQQIELDDIKDNTFYSKSIKINERFVNSQVMLELRASNCNPPICITAPHFCSRMKAKLNENEGNLIITSEDNKYNRLPRIYVKVFAKINSKAVFYKDGYTDILGYFDYYTTSDIFQGNITEFAILLHSETFGADIISDISPPPSKSQAQDSRIVRIS